MKSIYLIIENCLGVKLVLGSFSTFELAEKTLLNHLAELSKNPHIPEFKRTSKIKWVCKKSSCDYFKIQKINFDQKILKGFWK